MSERQTRLSMSAIETYQTCPWQFKLQRFSDPALPSKKTPQMLLGSAVHRFVERLEKKAPFERRFYYRDLKKLRNTWSRYWVLSVSAAIQSNTLITAEESFNIFPGMAIGRACLENYWNFFYDKPKPRSVEEKIDIKFANGWSFRAIIDQVREIGNWDWLKRNNPEAYRNRDLYDPVAIVDLKTGWGDYEIGKLSPGEANITDHQIRRQFSLHEGTQATAYAWAYFQKYGKLPAVFYWYHMRSNRFYPTFRTPEHFKDLYEKITHVIENVEANSFPTHEGFACKSCPYIDYCKKGRELLLVKPEKGISAAGEQRYYVNEGSETEQPKQLRLKLKGTKRRKREIAKLDIHRGPKQVRLIGFDDGDLDGHDFEPLKTASVT